MKKALLLSLSLFIINHVNAQSFNWAFALDTLNGYSNSEGLCVATDSLGNSYLGGTYYGEPDFDPGPGVDSSAILNTDDGGFLAKYDAAGNFVWCKKWPSIQASTATHRITHMQFDKNGILYFVLQSSTWSAHGALIYKMDTDSGTFTHVHTFFGTGTACGAVVEDFSIDDSLNFYLVMSIIGTVNLNPGYVNSAGVLSTDILAVKLDSTGVLLWAKQFGRGYVDEGVDIDADSYGNVYFTGTFRDRIDVDPGPDTVLLVAGNPSADTRFIVKLNSIGDYINAKQASSSNIYFSKFEINANDQLVCVDNNHIALLDSSINNVWKKVLTNTVPANVRLDELGNIFSFGSFSSGNDFDPGPGTYTLPLLLSFNHFFVSKLDQNGNFQAALGFHLKTNSRLNAINVSDQHVLLTGILKDTADMDPYATVYNVNKQNQAFVCKLSKCVVSSPAVSINGCDSLVINSQTFFNSGSYTQTLRTTAGCDSTVVLNLTINQSNSSNLTTTACDSLLYHGQYYSTTGLYHVTLVNANGCDSIVHLNLTVKQSYAISKTVTACPGYLFAGNYLTTSGVYYDSLQSIAGCDSVRILNLAVVSSFNNTINPTACKKYTSPSGNIYTTSGTYIDTLTSVNGCDSIININLTVLDPGNHVYQFNQTVYCNIANLQYQWVICNGSALTPITGAISQSYTTNLGGSYALIVTQNGCKDTSVCFTLATVGINNVEAAKGLSVYPNPVSDVINIDLQTGSSTNNGEAYLYTLQGQLISSCALYQHHNTITTEKLASGFYFLKIETGSNTFTKKILIL